MLDTNGAPEPPFAMARFNLVISFFVSPPRTLFVGGTCAYTCPKGMMPSSSVTCNGGTWSGAAKCTCAAPNVCARSDWLAVDTFASSLHDVSLGTAGIGVGKAVVTRILFNALSR